MRVRANVRRRPGKDRRRVWSYCGVQGSSAPDDRSVGSAEHWDDTRVRRSSSVVRVRKNKPYLYGIVVCMKKTLNIDDQLIKEAKLACGATTDTDTVRLGLEALVRHAAYDRLRALRGSEPHARDVSRRREKPSARHRVA